MRKVLKSQILYLQGLRRAREDVCRKKRKKLLRHAHRNAFVAPRSRTLAILQAGNAIRPQQASWSPNSSHYTTCFPGFFDIVRNSEETLIFFRTLKQVLLLDPIPELVIDANSLQVLAPEASLVLLAELERSQSPSLPRRTRIKAIESRNPRVQELLSAVGYCDHFENMPQVASSSKRAYVKITSGVEADGAVADKFLEEFRTAAKFTSAEEQSLYSAMLECMINVRQHAYPEKFKIPHLSRWWMLGWKDIESHEVALCFFDQGIGIPKTIRTRWKEMLPFTRPTDEDLIIKAVLEGHSSTQEPTRGTGLPTFKQFLDEHKSGELVIVSDRSMCIFKHGCRPVGQRLRYPLGGTLVLWTLKARE